MVHPVRLNAVGHRRAAPAVLSVALALVALAAVLAPGRASRAAPNEAAVSDGGYALEATWPLPPSPFAPIDTALGPDGTLYLADGRANTVRVYRASGELQAEWSGPRIGLGPAPEFVYVPLAIAVDPTAEQVHLLWERRRLSGEALVPDGLFLDSRGYDGQSTRPPLGIPVTAVPTADDMALHGPSGDLLLLGEAHVHRLHMPARTLGSAIEIGTAVGAGPGRLAVTPDGRVAVVRPPGRTVAVYTLDGQALPPLPVGAHTPVAVASDALGGLHVLVRAADTDDPAAPLVVRLAADGAPVWTGTAGALRAPPPPPGRWPWAVDVSPAGAVLASGTASFSIHRYDAGWQPTTTLDGAPTAAAFEPAPRDASGDRTLALATGPDGAPHVLDGREGRVVRFGPDGQPSTVAKTPDQPLDLALGPSGALYISTAAGRLLQLAPGEAPTPTLEIDCGCRLGGRLAAARDVVYATRPRYQSVARFDALDGVPRGELQLPDGVGLWPSDIARTADGQVFTGDLVTARVQRWRDDGALGGSWPAGLLAGPRRLAAGVLDDGTPALAVAMADGHVELHSAADGNLLARWQPTLPDGSTFEVADVALGADGRVFLADRAARTLRVFGPGAGAPPTPVAEPTSTPTPAAGACAVTGDKRAGPPELLIGDTAAVTLTLAADCPASAQLVGADIVLVIDRSASMHAAKMEAAKGAARAFAELLDVRYHRLGVAAFSTDATIEVPLTDSVPTVVDGIERLARDPDGQTNITAAIERARASLEAFGRDGALPVLIVLTDGIHNVGDTDPTSVAAEARRWGAQIYTIGLGDDVDGTALREIAGTPARYFDAPTPSELFPIYGQILRLVLSSLAGNLIIDDTLADGMTYIEGSSQPEALVDPGGRLRWGRSILPATGVTLTYRVRPDALGCQPVNRVAVADYTDGDGARRQYTFPVPTVCVRAPTATPTPSPTPTATPTPEPQDIYLPVAYHDHCLPGIAAADVVLLIDTSSSMAGRKLQEAKRAAAVFVRQLDLPRDRAAVIGFDRQPRVATSLTGDRATLEAAVAALEAGQGTLIDLALRQAALEVALRSGPTPSGRPRRAVVILLSDGAHSGPDAQVLTAGASVRAVGATLFTIGLGADADRMLLEQLADPGQAYVAPDTRDLEAIYRSIAVAIPCR